MLLLISDDIIYINEYKKCFFLICLRDRTTSAHISGMTLQESSYFGALLGTSAPSTSKSPPSIDPHAEYMAGACMVRAPALEVPDFKGFRKEGLKSVPRRSVRCCECCFTFFKGQD